MSRKCSTAVFASLLASEEQGARIPTFLLWIRTEKRKGANPYGSSRLKKAGTNIVHRMSGGL